MPVNLDIENVPDELIARLNLRASRNGRSLEAEVLSILEEATRAERRLTPTELLEEVKKFGFETPDKAADIVRKMRDGRYGDAWCAERENRIR